MLELDVHTPTLPQLHRSPAGFLAALRGVQERENLQCFFVGNGRLLSLEKLDNLHHQRTVPSRRLGITLRYRLTSKHHRAIASVRTESAHTADPTATPAAYHQIGAIGMGVGHFFAAH